MLKIDQPQGSTDQGGWSYFEDNFSIDFQHMKIKFDQSQESTDQCRWS